MFMGGFTASSSNSDGTPVACVNLLSTEWTLDSPLKFAIACIGVVLMGIGVQYLSLQRVLFINQTKPPSPQYIKQQQQQQYRISTESPKSYFTKVTPTNEATSSSSKGEGKPFSYFGNSNKSPMPLTKDREADTTTSLLQTSDGVGEKSSSSSSYFSNNSSSVINNKNKSSSYSSSSSSFYASLSIFDYKTENGRASIYLTTCLFYTIEQSLSYLLMLVAMTYSIELFIMVVLGLAIGFALFKVQYPSLSASQSVDPCCQFGGEDEEDT